MFRERRKKCRSERHKRKKNPKGKKRYPFLDKVLARGTREKEADRYGKLEKNVQRER